MMEIVIVAVIVLWTVFAIKSSRRHKCCGDCEKCMRECKKADGF